MALALLSLIHPLDAYSAETVFSETFEGGFPGLWSAWDSNGTGGSTYWGTRTARKSNGSKSAWCAGSKSETEETILNEGFEGTFTWDTGDSNPDGTEAKWKDVYSTFGGEGTRNGGWKAYCAGIGYGGDSTNPYHRDKMDAYMSRSLDLRNYARATLKFWYKAPTLNNSNDYLQVFVNGIEVLRLTSVQTTWTESAPIDLTAYAGQLPTLKFNFHSATSWSWQKGEGFYLDDIVVTAVRKPEYDNNMDAYLKRRVDLSDYLTASLQYSAWYETESNVDYLALEYSDDDRNWTQIEGSKQSGSGQGGWWTATANNLPGGKPLWLRFLFHSNGSTVKEGAYLDDIIVEGTKRLVLNPTLRTSEGDPIKQAKVKAYKGDGTYIAEAMTDDNGNVNIPTNLPYTAGMQVKLMAYPDNDASVVVNQFGTLSPYEKDNFAITQNPYREEIVVDEYHDRPFAINSWIWEARRFLETRQLTPLPSKTTITYPGLSETGMYTPASRGIDIPTDYDGEHTTQHEYGHAVMHRLYNFGYPQISSHPVRHNLETKSDEGFALSEGWASFFDCHIEGCGWDDLSDIETFKYGTPGEGQVYEANVMGIMWDISDGANDDQIDSQFRRLWDILRDKKPNGISSIIGGQPSIHSAWFEGGANSGDWDKLNDIYTAHNAIHGDDGFETDDIYINAKEITSGARQTKSIDVPSDTDWVKFTLSNYSNVVIETDGPNGGATDIRLFNGYLTPLTSDTDGGNGSFSKISFEGLEPGTYYVSVTEAGRDQSIPTYWMDFTATAVHRPPTLTWLGGAYESKHGVSPRVGTSTTSFTYKVFYLERDNEAPQSGYPRLVIRKGGSDITGSPFVMDAETFGAYSTGRTYSRSIVGLEYGTDYTYFIEAKDAGGTSARTETKSGPWIGDGTPPGAPTDLIIYPSSWSRNSSFLVDWTDPNDLSGIAGAFYKFGQPPLSGTDFSSYTERRPLDITATLQGGQTVYVWLKDNSGNSDFQTARSAVLFWDPSPPGRPTNLTISPSSWTNSNSFTLDWSTPADGMSGIEPGIYVKLGSAPLSNMDGTFISSKPVTLSATAESGQLVYCWLRDNAGNADHAAAATSMLLLDTSAPPPVEDLRVSPDGWMNAATATVTWRNPADASGVAGAYYKQGVAPISSTDGQYSTAPYLALSPTVDNGEPVYVWLKDNAGNVDHQMARQVLILRDAAPPTSISSFTGTIGANGWHLSSVTVHLEAHDVGGSGPRGVEYRITPSPYVSYTSSLAFVLDGATTLYYRALDMAGNIEVERSTIVRVDASPPAPGPVPIHQGSFSSRTITWTWLPGSDSGSGVAGYHICVTTNPSICDAAQALWTGSTSYVFLDAQNGLIYYASVRAADIAGHAGAFGPMSFGVMCDTRSPAGYPSTPTHVTQWSSSTLAFRWSEGSASDGESGITGFYLQVGEAPESGDLFDGDVGMTFTRAVPGGQNGRTYYARVRARDGAGNYGQWSPYSVGVRVETSPPGVSGSFPSDGQVFNSASTPPAHIDVSLVDAESGVDTGGSSLRIDRDASDFSTQGTFVSTVANHLLYYPKAALPDGLYAISVSPRDNVGNLRSPPIVIRFRIDRRPPSAAFANLAEGVAVAGSAVPIKISPPEDLASSYLQWRKAGDAAWSPVGPTVTTQPFIHWWDTSALEQGRSYDLKATLIDFAGNAKDAMIRVHSGTNPAVLANRLDPNASVSYAMPSGGTMAVPARTLPAGSGMLAMQSRSAVALSDPSLYAAIADAERRAAAAGLRGSAVSDHVRVFEALDSSGTAITAAFNDWVTVEIPYEDSDGDGLWDGTRTPVDKLRLYRLNPAVPQWEMVSDGGANQAIVAQKKVVAQLRHFSAYTLMGPSGTGASLGDVLIYPVPWKPGSSTAFDSADVNGCGRGLIFDRLTVDAVIKIYSLQGDLVRKLDVGAGDGGCKAWDGKNNSGRDAASGIYVALIQNPSGERLLKKFAIQR